jgi:xanthine dehydrogenase molybdopterin-binding subunit B
VKYGIGWNGYNAGIRIGVRGVDGTVTIAHSGCEIGQGINTKMAQAVAYELGIDMSLIRVTSTSTEKISNGGVTGGSGTSEVIVQAAINACDTLNNRLDPYRSGAKKAATRGSRGSGRVSAAPETATEDWIALLQSLPYDVSLNVEGWYSPVSNPNGQEFQYFVYGAAVTEVEVDVLSGDVMVLSSEIVYDCGQSLNPAVDIGK